jgi:hypothetical protein
MYLVRCDCGREVEVSSQHLRKGHTRSCGCLNSERIGALRRRHGMSDRAEHRIWMLMLGRCSVVTNPDYRLYGGRGIQVCGRWHVFEHFFADMGPRPTAQHSIDRINVNGDYEPGNCRWATAKEQRRNCRNVILDEEGARQIRALAVLGVERRWLASAFGVKKCTIDDVINRQTWV